MWCDVLYLLCSLLANQYSANIAQTAPFSISGAETNKFLYATSCYTKTAPPSGNSGKKTVNFSNSELKHYSKFI